MIVHQRKMERTEKTARKFFRKVSLLAGLLTGCGTMAALAQSAASVTLAWDSSASPAITGYRLYQGTASQSYYTNFSVGNVTNATVAGLLTGGTYYFAVTALDTNGLESAYSSEVTYTVPLATPPAISMTSPANGASSAAPATLNLAAGVTANGHTINKVQFYNGSALLGEVAASPYTFTWNNVASGSYNLSAQAIYDVSNTVASSAISVVVTNPPVTTTPPPTPTLPAPWVATSVGTPGTNGSACLTNGIYLVYGAGNLSGMADNFQFLYQPISGDGEIRAQITSQLKTSVDARTGVMIRETLTPGSRYVFMGIAPTNSYRLQTRTTTSGNSGSLTAGSAPMPNSWVRLVRSGNAFLCYTSADGVTWAKAGSKKMSMAANTYVGVAVASGSTNTLSRSSFTNLVVVP